MKGLFLIILLIFFGTSLYGQVFNSDDAHFTVAQDGSGDFLSVQEAIDAVPDFRANETVIFIKKGTYKEKLILPQSKTKVKLVGEDCKATIITFDDHAKTLNRFGEPMGTTGSSVFFVFGTDFSAHNLTFENSAGPVAQAVAVRVSGDRAFFNNCRFLGFQDTLYPQGTGTRQYYKNCYIEGTVDFIFGWATAYFDECEVFCKTKGYVTAASTDKGVAHGFVFRNCRITGSAPAGSVYLGRPWRPHAQTVFLNCFLDTVIHPQGWHNWNKPDAESTTWYAEYQSHGPGANPTTRVAWSHQLTHQEAAEYTPEKVLAGNDGWMPIADLQAQVSDVWVSDLGNGRYKNPVLHADYSDPDVIRVGNNFYMTASSFNCIPGLPILHSNDLVNWRLVNYALRQQLPADHFSMPQHGNGVWAPSIRFHKGEYYIYYGDPDFGIYMVKTSDPHGKWDDPVLVKAGKGLIDPCPLWDEDGRAYLVHAYAGSRAGIKSILVVAEMSADGTLLLEEGSIVFDGHNGNETVEGPKFYKKDGYYYILAPAGGVTYGWQLAMRSRSPYGPYQWQKVMHQGSTSINGPHQGGWVELESGENWFVHFQDKGPFGRVVHLNPVTWVNGWPVMGIDKDGDGTGEPVTDFKKPDVGKTYAPATPAGSDEFDAPQMGLQWQWHANPENTWAFLNPGKGQLRLFTGLIPEGVFNYWQVPNLLLQKFPAPEFTVSTRMTFSPNEKLDGERAGLMVMGLDYASLALEKRGDEIYIVMNVCEDAMEGAIEKEVYAVPFTGHTIEWMVEVDQEARCTFSYCVDEKKTIRIDHSFTAREGRWIGAKVGLFATRKSKTNDSGFADFDWFRIVKK